MSIDSHIQITNFILRNFRSPHGRVDYLDLTTGRIRSCGSDRLGTEPDYYSAEMEKYLNKEIETPFSNLAAEVLSFVEKKIDKIVLSNEVETTVKKYVTASMARSSLCFNSYMKASITADLLEPQANHDSIVFYSTQRDGGINPLVQNSKMYLIVNLSERQFVVPRNCFYGVPRKGYTCIAVPISPLCIILLAPEKYPEEYIAGESCRLYKVFDGDIVGEMNIAALHYEWCFNHLFVASASRQELEKLKQYMEKKKNQLDSIKVE